MDVTMTPLDSYTKETEAGWGSSSQIPLGESYGMLYARDDINISFVESRSTGEAASAEQVYATNPFGSASTLLPEASLIPSTPNLSARLSSGQVSTLFNHHVDSGIRFGPPCVVDLPPEYTDC